ncbi:Uncharacterised protein [Chromobacterium violaceum]|uniref:Uncharacterized protein n=1 Tax=Chromobacterium violaceum TaxID=536 RepID=A0A447TL72_CHRVL|nr:Uncharacterised protein [Chromobacterium violaceum]
MPRSATISILRSANSRYTSTPVLSSVSHTRSSPNHCSARSLALMPRQAARQSSADSTTKRSCPRCARSDSAICRSSRFS